MSKATMFVGSTPAFAIANTNDPEPTQRIEPALLRARRMECADDGRSNVRRRLHDACDWGEAQPRRKAQCSSSKQCGRRQLTLLRWATVIPSSRLGPHTASRAGVLGV